MGRNVSPEPSGRQEPGPDTAKERCPGGPGHRPFGGSRGYLVVFGPGSGDAAIDCGEMELA